MEPPERRWRRCAVVCPEPRQRSLGRCGARGRARNPRPGGPGQPSAGTRTGCLQWLDVAGTKEGGSPLDRGATKKLPEGSAPGSTAPGTEKPHVERRVASASIARRARRKAETGSATRRSIPSHFSRGTTSPAPRGRGAKQRGPARGRPKSTGDGACPVIPGRERSERTRNPYAAAKRTNDAVPDRVTAAYGFRVRRLRAVPE